MDASKLRSYLKIVSNLEKEKYTIECILNAIQQEIDTQKFYAGARPTPPVEPVNPASSAQPIYRGKNKSTASGCISVIIAGVVILFIISSLIGTLSFLGAIASNTPILAIIIGVVTIVAPIITYFAVKRDKKNRQKQAETFGMQQYKNQYADYQDAMARYHVQLQNYEQNVRNFEEQQRQYKKQLQGEYNRVKSRYDETCRLLSDYYALNIIPATENNRYRKLIPVCMFYDYLSTGRTYSMERGLTNNDPGAINMYEDDVYRGRVLRSLSDIRDEIQVQSSAIQSRMTSVYDALQESQEETRRYLSSVNSSISQSNRLQRQTNSALEEQNYLTRVRIEQDKYRNDLLTRAFYN